MPALRLSHKLFLAFALLTGVVLSLAGWSLLTTRRLDGREPHDHRARAARGSPRGRRSSKASPRFGAWRRATRCSADPAYVRLFAERAQTIESDLVATLGDLVSTPEERQTLADAAEELRQLSKARRAPARREGRDSSRRRLRLERWPSGSTDSPAPSCAGAEPRPRRSTSRAVSWRSSRSRPASRWPSPSPGSRAARIARPLRELRAAARASRATQALRAHSRPRA